MKFKTKQNLTMIFTPLISILTILLVLQSIIPSYAEEFRQLSIDIRYTNYDRASAHNIIMKIYHEGTNDLYAQLTPNSEYPYFVAFLPIDQEFRIDAFVNGMYSGSYNVDVRNKQDTIDFTIPVSSGVKIHVLYDDKYTPIEGANIQIKNHEGKILRKDFTDKNGNTLRFWTAPTIVKDNFYEVEISIAENIVHKYSPLILNPGERKDLKISTPWPKVIDSLITVHAYKQNFQPLFSANGKYTAELHDKDDNLIAKSNFNIRGDAFFSHVPVGEYRLFIKDNQLNQITFFANETIPILGDTNEINIIEQKFVKSISKLIAEDLGFIQQEEIIVSKQEPEVFTQISSQKQEIPKISCNCVAFRFDDVQDHWLNDVQIEVLEVFENKNSPITIGVIGDRIGNDEKIISYIDASTSNGSLEIANHGWQHEDFSQFNKTHQTSLIQKTNEKIQDLFGVKPSVFIPPFNSFNENTMDAMLGNGITHFSSEFDFSTPPFPLVDAQLYNFPEGAVTGKLTPNKTFIMGVSHKLTLSQVKQSIDEYGFAVVTMHPQEFSEIKMAKYLNQVNEKQIRELELLLDRLRIEEIKITPLSEINLDSNQNDSIPIWIKNIAKWWAEGKISEAGFVVAMQFLVKDNVIFLTDIPDVSNNASKEIPVWIKNNAEWWAEGKISDAEFASGIKFFIENGIISV